jgi:ABC-2 type transport system ATP-binding protein
VALQEAGLDDLQTGRELLRLQSRLYGLARGAIEDRIAELLVVVDLEDAADRRIGTYSGGMRRRLDLASALVHAPSIIFLDEPTTGLDPISRESLWRYVQRLNQEDGVTFFLTTQYLEEADRLAHDVAILDAGEIVAQGSPQELKASIGAEVVMVELGSAAEAESAQRLEGLAGVEEVRRAGRQVSIYVPNGSAAVSGIVRALDEAGLAFGDVRLSQPTLDDVFLRATGHHMEVTTADETSG